ncbi:M24 family metallopeptidase [Elongatibacter sediminis]|uniref:M24 family metallopeptidase n=1 Tax=Elongatibacter sediminis TaxID=3119006 RepID=A0AAW9RCB5_9GAMM
MKTHLSLLVIAVATLASCTADHDTAEEPQNAATGAPSVERESLLLPWTEQLRIRQSWLETRHEMLLEMMRRHGIDMWIVVNEEFNNDPLTEYIAPPRPYAGNRDIFIFIDSGDDAGLRTVALTGYEEENLARFFELAQFKPDPNNPRKAREVLAELYAEHQPGVIGLGTGGHRGMSRSLSHDSYLLLSEAMGEEATAKFVSAEGLIEEYLETRIPEELPHYTKLVQLTEEITRRALSNEVIDPGRTTVGDVRNWLYDALWDAGVETWFQPDMRVQRHGLEDNMSRGFLAVAPESMVIERGDVIHVDFGISYMGFDTDWQKHAYVLREGEDDVPQGLKDAMANTNALQDALMLRASRPGRTAGAVHDATMAEMQEKGIEAQIYSHPLGNHGHGMGAGISFSNAKNEARASKTLRKGAYIAIELNTKTPVPEWDNQDVFIMMEDPAHLTDDGWEFFRPRQEAFYLIR